MQSEIKYNGYTTSPSDYSSPDGDMAFMLNCVPEEGGITSTPGATVFTYYLGENAKENLKNVYIHKTQSQDNHICISYSDADVSGTYVIEWAKAPSIPATPVLVTKPLFAEGEGAGVRVKSFSSVGNTLVLLDEDGHTHYFLWNGTGYDNLGTNIPDLDLCPTLVTTVDTLADLSELYDEISYESDTELPLTFTSVQQVYTENTAEYFVDSAKKEGVYNKVFSVVNPVQNTLRKNGHFLYPFYLRLAYRLVDGSHVMHTVPYLMCPTTQGTSFLGIRLDGENQKVFFSPLFPNSTIHLKGVLKNLLPWKKLITHIDVFVTPPIINYTDTPETIKSITPANYASYDNGWNTDYRYDTLISNEGSLVSLKERYDNTHTEEDLFNVIKTLTFKAGEKFYPGSKTGNYYRYLVVDIKNGSVGRLFYWDNLVSHTIEPLHVSEIPAGLPLPTHGKYKVYKVYNYPLRFKAIKGTVYGTAYKKKTGVTGFKETFLQLNLNRCDDKLFSEALTEYSTFYKCAEINLDDIVVSNNVDVDIPVVIKQNILSTLTTQSVLKDLGQMRTRNIVSSTFVYNNRLNLCVSGEEPATCAGINQQNNIYTPVPDIGDEVNLCITSAHVKLEDNGQVIYKDVTGDIKTSVHPLYFCYPSLNAVELILTKTYNLVGDNGNLELGDNGPKEYTAVESIILKQHPYLNLAYAFNDFNSLSGSIVDSLPSFGRLDYFTRGNIIKTSGAGNPFAFTEDNTSELSVNKIYGLSTAAQALSQGQFGQYPLYAFTDEGIWALEVSSSGTFSSRQVITRDVCINPSSITQLDNAVLFVSDRGLMLLSGSQTQCISEVLDNKAFDVSQLTYAYSQIRQLADINSTTFKSFVKKAKILYDYPTQKIVVFNPGEIGYSYIYSLRSKQWGIMQTDFIDIIPGYPRGYILNKSIGELICLLQLDETKRSSLIPRKSCFITRPITLDSPDSYKTITGIIQRGNFRDGAVSTMLYGSRDLQTWYPIYGSKDHRLRGMRGTSYKYFRIASIFDLEVGESIQGCSIQYDNRLENKMR